MALYDNLFKPLKIGSVELKNRIVRSPHGTGLSGEDLISYHEARAKGGVAMSTIQATGVHKSAPQGIPLHTDDCKPFLTKTAYLPCFVPVPSEILLGCKRVKAADQIHQ